MASYDEYRLEIVEGGHLDLSVKDYVFNVVFGNEGVGENESVEVFRHEDGTLSIFMDRVESPSPHQDGRVFFTETPTNFDCPKFWAKECYTYSYEYGEHKVFVSEISWEEISEEEANYYTMVECHGEWSFFPTWKEGQGEPFE